MNGYYLSTTSERCDMTESRGSKSNHDCRPRSRHQGEEHPPLERGRMINPCNGNLIGMTVEEGHELIARLLPLGWVWKPEARGRPSSFGATQGGGELLDPQGNHAGECWSGKMWLPARTVAVLLPLLMAENARMSADLTAIKQVAQLIEEQKKVKTALLRDPDLLWSEDECTRGTKGHEDEVMAWQRLGLGDFPGYAKANEVDHGDCFEYQFPNGVSVWNIHGAYHEIRRTKETASKDLPPQPGDDEQVNDEPNSPTWGQLFGRGKEAKP